MSAYKNMLIAIVLVLLASLALKDSTSGASVTPKENPKWEHVQVMSYASGLTGFFDTSNGRLYLYGSDIKTPFAISELQTLGDPLKIVKAPGS